MTDDTVQLTINYRCHQCNTPIVIPLKRDWSSPLYVMHMEREHKIIREMLGSMQADLMALAAECVESGVRPEILKRADRTRDLFRELKRRLGIE